MTIDRRTLIAGGLAGWALAPLAAAPSARIRDLIARMTIAEKAGQLSCYSDVVRPVDAVFNPVVNPASADAQLADIRNGRIGMIFNGTGVAGGRRAQAAALESRLRIPLLLAADVLHGHTTIFPIPLAEAAAFDPALAETSARWIAREASAAGLHWTFAPMVDVARDQRWGRVAEGAGEDVHLGSLYAAARVRGFQGGDLARSDSLAATPKHFAGYGAVTGGMEYAEVDVSDATLREVHLPPFAAAFAAGAAATMTSFTSLSGVPATGNRRLLSGILRDEMRFSGPAVTDYDADRELIAHGYASDEADAAAKAILAGADISMQSGLYARHLPALVASGRVPMARVDAAVARVLALKERLGLFDDPWRSLDARTERRVVGAPAVRAAAREAAVRSIVLLKNDRDVLPLRPGAKLALIGPLGADRRHLNGPWSFAGRAAQSIDLATALAPHRPTVVQGCGIDTDIPGGIDAAVAAARAADVVVLAVGEGGDMSGEGNSRVDIGIPAPQLRLAAAVAATGTPIVAVLSHGRGLALAGAVAEAGAILACWFLGSESGTAVADILYGRREPTGRLPVSFPRATGQSPWSYDRPSSGRPILPPPAEAAGRAGWRDATDTPLYGFGHGLGYTRFSLSGLTVPDTLGWGLSLEVSVGVSNVGPRTGETVVQLYIRDVVAGRTRPRRLLKAFTRVRLDAGTSRTVTLTVSHHDLAYIDADGRTVIDPGAFRLWAALSSDDPGLEEGFTLQPPYAAGAGSTAISVTPA